MKLQFKLHRPVLQHVVNALEQTFGQGYYADKVLERVFKSDSRLGSRDRKFIAESFYDIVRWWRLLWAVLGKSEPSLDKRELWRVLAVWLALEGVELPDWPEFSGLTSQKLRETAEQAKRDPAVRESVPTWLYELGLKELGDKWSEVLTELNHEAPVVLRVNRLRTTREELQKRLAADEITSVYAPSTDDGLILSERRNIFTHELFKAGHFEVQDGASQQVAPLLNPKPGDRVIDACAGAGGKSLHLAALMKNKGKIIAMDLHEKKLDQLRKRCTRNGVDIVESRVIEGAKTIKRLEATADRLLLDVPCTGLGVLRRNPDTKWKLSLEQVENLNRIQAEILSTYSTMVKKGGFIVYATCSVLPSENEKQVERFINENGTNFRLVEEKRFMPSQGGYDGFYAALIERI